MAIVRATKTGNWSDTTVWNTGALPTSADDVYSNTFTVTIDQSATVLQISNAAATGVTAGGGFVMSAGGYTLTANVNASLNVNCLTVSNGVGTTATVVGNVQAGSVGKGIAFTGAGTLNVTGNSTGGTGTNGYGIDHTGTGTINLTGAVNGSGSTSGHGIRNSSSGTFNITGTATGGSAGAGIVAATAGPVNHTGTVQASTGAPGVDGVATAVLTLTGPFLTSTNGLNPVTAGRWFWLNTSPPATYYQIRSANLSVIRPLYTADSVGGNPATSNVRSGTVYGPSNELTGTAAIPGASSVLAGVPVDATTGTATISAADIRAAVGLASANLDSQLAAKPTATAIRTEMDSNSTKLANLDATVSSRSTYAGADTSGTTTLLSRLSSIRAGYLDNLATAPPSAVDIATAVWAAATRTLTTAIDNSATIAAAVWAYATGRTITGGTVDTLTNAPSVPSAATIASQVRTELSTELARIDATVSSRLAPAGTLARVTLTDTVTTVTNSSPVDAAEIAEAVRTELTPELERVANCATVETTGDQIAGLQ
jgi:hypothetical protein